MRRCFTFIRIWFWLVILETWSLVQDANDALSRIKVSGATPAAECNDVEGTMRYPSLVDEYIPHSSDSLSVSHLLNSSSLSTLFFLFPTMLDASTRCPAYCSCVLKYSIYIYFLLLSPLQFHFYCIFVCTKRNAR